MTVASWSVQRSEAQAWPTDPEQVCTIPPATFRRKEVVPGILSIAALQRAARDAYFRVRLALDNPDNVRVGGDIRTEYPKYLALREEFDRALGPLVDDVPLSVDGAKQFLTMDELAGSFARCLEKDGRRSVTADHMRRKVRDLSPFLAQMWTFEPSVGMNDQEFAERIGSLGFGKFAGELPELAPLIEAAERRVNAGWEQQGAAIRARNERDAQAINQAIADRRQAGIRAREELANRGAAREEAERRARAKGLPVSDLTIYGLPLGSYPTPEDFQTKVAEAFDCPAMLAFRTSDTGTSGDREVRAGCSVFGMMGPSLSATFKLEGYRLTEVRQSLYAGDFRKCYAINDEREKASFATQVRAFEKVGWRLVARRPREYRNALGVAIEPLQSNEYRRGNVTLEIWETGERVVDPGCYPAFHHRDVMARYRL